MLEHEDRFDDYFYHSTEIADYHAELLKGHYTSIECNFYLFSLYKNDKNTGKKILLAGKTNNITIALKADWKPADIVIKRDEVFNNCNTSKLLCIYTVLDKYKYKPKYVTARTADRVFSWEDWMRNLLI